MPAAPLAALSLVLLLLLPAGADAAGASPARARIEFWTVGLRPKFTAFMEDLVRRYQAQHPGTTVEWVDYPWDVLQTKLVARIVAGKPPALVNLNVPRADEFARDGLLLPVDALMGEARGRYLPAALADLTFGGRLYGFPFYSNVGVIAYNREVFRQAGLTRAPRSLDEQLAFARQIAARTGKAGLAPLLGSVDGFFLQQGLPVLERGRAAFATPRHAGLVRKLAETYRAGGLLKDSLFAEDNFAAVIAAYKGGRLGMVVAPPSALGRIAADAPDVYAVTEVAPAPLGPTGIADGGWLLHMAVPRGVAPSLLPEAGRFALFLTNDENQLAFARLANVFPTTVAAGADPHFATLPPDADPAARAKVAAAASMRHARTLYVAGIEDYDELRRTLVRAVEAGVTGRRDIAAALAEAAAAWDRKLARQTQPAMSTR